MSRTDWIRETRAVALKCGRTVSRDYAMLSHDAPQAFGNGILSQALDDMTRRRYS
jgi:hypothetical protein